MLGRKFETWPATSFSNTIFVIFGIHVIDLSFLKNGLLYFTELPNNGTKKSNRMLVGLDTAAVIQKTDNQDPLDLMDLKAK